MQRLSLMELLAVVLVSAAILTFTEAPVYAQAQKWQEPTLEGITYSEMAEWSFRYGGGAMYGGMCPPMPPPGIWDSRAPHYVGPPPFSRKKARSRRK